MYRAHSANGKGYVITGWGRVVSTKPTEAEAIRLAEQLNRAMGLSSDGHESERLERKQGVESDPSEWAWWRSD